MRRLGILYRLISNYFFNPNFRGGNYNRSVLSHVVFLLNLSILYNLLCALSVKGYNKAFTNNSLAKAVSRGFLSKGFLFGGLRFLGPEQKNRFFQSVVLSEMPPQQAAQFGSNSEPISLLQHQGYVNLGQFFDAEQCEGVRNYFCSSRGFASQVPLQSDGELQLFDLEDLKKRQAKSYFCFPDETSLRCDAIKNVLRDGSFQAMADAYLGFPAKLYSVNTFMSLTDPAITMSPAFIATTTISARSPSSFTGTTRAPPTAPLFMCRVRIYRRPPTCRASFISPATRARSLRWMPLAFMPEIKWSINSGW